MQVEPITPRRVDELLRYLPLFDVPGREYIVEWRGGEKTRDGTLTTPYPRYVADVAEFFALAGQPWWSDYDYQPADARKMVEDDALAQDATLKGIKSMLTYCVRGERFAPGHWAAMLESGRVVAILKRLEVLRESGLGEDQ